jgi:anti-anti-sigma factor
MDGATTELAGGSEARTAEFLDSCTHRNSGPESVLRTDRVVLAVSGRLDAATAPKFRLRVMQLLTLHLEALTLDLRGVTDIDGYGIAALAVAHREARARGIEFELASVPAAVPDESELLEAVARA